MGAIARVHCDLDGVRVTAQLPSARAAEFTPGGRVALQLDVDAVMVVPVWADAAKMGRIERPLPRVRDERWIR